MADEEITGLTEQTDAPASDDLVEGVDVSDTTMSANGTNKKHEVSNFLKNRAGFDNLLKNGNFNNASTSGYGGRTPDDWENNDDAYEVQGGFPSMTKQELIDLLGVADGDIEGLWNLDESSGNATDLSSNSYDLTDTNTVGSNTANSLMSAARDFESTNSEYFTLSSVANLRITGSQTFFCWIRPESLPGTSMRIMGRGNSGASFNFVNLLTNVDSSVQFQVQNLTTNTTVDTDVVLETGEWYFVCGVYDSSNTKLKVWINGIKTEVTASGTTTAAGTESFSIGRCGAYAADYFDGLIQNACVVSTALTDDQVKKLWAYTTWKGCRVQRISGNDGYIYQELPQNIVEQLRGKDVCVVAQMNQDTASIGQISVYDGTTETASSTSTTTDSWLDVGVTATMASDADQIEVRCKVSDSNGNVWFKEVMFYEGDVLIYKWTPGQDDVNRFPRLLAMNPPETIDGYQFEEKRWFTYTPSFGGFSSDPSSVTANYYVDGNYCNVNIYQGGDGTSNATSFTITLPINYVGGNLGNVVAQQGRDNGSALTTCPLIHITNNSTTMTIYKDQSTAAWTNSGSKRVVFIQGSYEIA